MEFFGGEEWLYPDLDTIYLRIIYTIRNIGTTSSSFVPSIGTLVYDGVYVFDSSVSDPIWLLNQSAMSPAETATVYYMIPNRVAESAGSLVIRFGSAEWEDISFVIRPLL